MSTIPREPQVGVLPPPPFSPLPVLPPALADSGRSRERPSQPFLSRNAAPRFGPCQFASLRFLLLYVNETLPEGRLSAPSSGVGTSARGPHHPRDFLPPGDLQFCSSLSTRPSVRARSRFVAASGAPTPPSSLPPPAAQQGLPGRGRRGPASSRYLSCPPWAPGRSPSPRSSSRRSRRRGKGRRGAWRGRRACQRAGRPPA